MLALVLLAVRGGRRDRRKSEADDVRAAEAAETLRQKDLEIARINADLANARHDADRAGHTEREPASAKLVEAAELVAAGAGAGALVARPHGDAHPDAAAIADLRASLHQRDQELERIKAELVGLRMDLERQREGAIHARHSHTGHSAADAALVVSEVAVVAAEPVRETVAVPPAHVAHHHAAAKPLAHSVIDEADWSITHYRVVIGEARARKHDRPEARAEVIRLSERMLAHYPDNDEAVSFARVSKAEALAEGGDHAAALLECETVIAHYSTETSKAVRTQLAQAHFVTAAIHARHKDVALCTAELDQWAKVYGIFDQRMVTEDVRFQEIITVPEFQVYIAHKTR